MDSGEAYRLAHDDRVPIVLSAHSHREAVRPDVAMEIDDVVAEVVNGADRPERVDTCDHEEGSRVEAHPTDVRHVRRSCTVITRIHRRGETLTCLAPTDRP